MPNIQENNPKLGVMVDCSRNSVMNVEALRSLIPVLSKIGYTTLMLYTEDTYEVNGEPYFGYLRGRYSKAELKEIDRIAADSGVELVPCIQTLAHLRGIFRWKEYAGIRDTADILLADDERTYELIEHIFETLAECFTSRRVNIGMDEAHALGSGKYRELHGEVPRAEIMLKHLKRVNEIANKHGFNCSMWSDMFFYAAFGGTNFSDKEEEIPKEIADNIPDNVTLIYWDYYSLDEENYAANIRSHLKLTDRLTFAGGVWSWVGLTPLNYYGIRAAKAAMAACRKNGVNEIFTTVWCDGGGSCSPFSVLPALVHTAEYAKGNFDEKSIKRKFYEAVGVRYDDFIALDLPNFLSADQDETVKCNAAKYLLYNDFLTGVNDRTVKEGVGEIYADHARRLKKTEKHPEYGFIFKTLRLLSECLYYKADFGIVARKLYAAGDKAGMCEFIEKRCRPLKKKLERFYEAIRDYWYRLYKPYGFEVTDIRLGGLIYRLDDVTRRLIDYLDGKVSSVPELEEPILGDGKEPCRENELLLQNTWGAIVTLNLL